MRPFASEGATAFFALVPVAFAGRRPAHDEFADLTVAEITAVLVHDARLVAGYRLAGRAIADVAWAVRQKRVQHLGRAKAVEHVDACDLAPALADMRGQGLAGGDAEPQAVGARALADAFMCEQCGVERGHAVKDRHAVALERLEHAFRRRPVR